MANRDEEFLRKLRATFSVEAAEHLQAIAQGLLAMERAPRAAEAKPLIEAVFRAAHSLKGAARAVNYTQLESSCQALEDVFAEWKRGKGVPSSSALDMAHRLLDGLSGSMASSGTSSGDSRATGSRSPAPAAARSADGAAASSVRITTSKLDTCLLEAEELLVVKLAIAQRATDLAALVEGFGLWRKEWAKIQPQARELRRATPTPPSVPAGTVAAQTGLADFLDWTRDHLHALDGRVSALRRAAEHDRLTAGRLIDELLTDTRQLLMLPVGTVATLFPKVVRDLCRDRGKQAELTVKGDEVEIDKRILEEMKDPLIHMLRNCVDHGIELPERRTAIGKPARATITLAVSAVDGNQIEIVVADDGAGIDVAKLKAVAIRKGLLSADDADSMSDRQAMAMIFEADLTTSPVVSEISGRGLGLAIVREKAQRLGGHVEVTSHADKGTAIRIRLPVTLTTFRGVLVGVADRLFVLPTGSVERVTRYRPDDVKTVEGRETLALQGRAVALVRLADVLGLESRQAATEASGPIVILGAGEQRTAFAVDAVIGEQEVLVKPLGKPLASVLNISGATILGSGQVAPILKVADLLASAKSAGAVRPAEPLHAGRSPVVRSVLVAEDSITSRLLLKGILESAGYRVTTAVDGLEAFTILRSERFDLLVSDIEMPRLGGLDLTARIRADGRLAELPVILVTALETREDRERGIEVGANAYLVKSSFDQSDLLDAVRRLI